MSPRWNPDPDVRTGRPVVTNLHVHLAYVTKYRPKAFTDEILTRCEEIMREVCTAFEADLKLFNGEQDPSLPGCCAGSTTRTCAGTCGADTSGPARTSPEAAAGRR